MKKILSALLLLGMLCACLASCGNQNISPIGAIYDPEWKAPQQFLEKGEELKGLKGDLVASNEGISVIRDGSSKNPITYVWSNYTNQIIGTYTDSDSVKNYITLIPTKYSSVYQNLKIGDSKTELMMYDATGKEYEKLDGNNIADVSTTISASAKTDLVLFNDQILYRENGDGTLTKVRDFALSTAPSLSGSDALQCRIGDFYYSAGTAAVKVYDSNLDPVFFYQLPSYAAGYSGISVLSNGKILAQITTYLPFDAVNYDYLGQGGSKYGLKTLLIDPCDGSEEEIELDAIIRSVIALTDDGLSYNDGMYAKGLENIAMIFRIQEDKYLDTNIAKVVPVLLSGDGKLGDEIDLGIDLATVSGNLSDLLSKVADDVYAAKDYHGMTYLFDESGNIINRLNLGKAKLAKNCIYTTDAIYSFTGDLLLDLAEKEGTIVGMLGGNPYVTCAEGSYIYREGKMELLDPTYTYHGDQLYSGTKDGKFVYYNVNGEVIATSAAELTLVAAVRDGYIMRTEAGVFYKFSYHTVLK